MKTPLFPEAHSKQIKIVLFDTMGIGDAQKCSVFLDMLLTRL